ncbi:MAG: BrnT family toxin [Planctomycetota bacterium]
MTEVRYYVLGKSNAHRRLFLVFTVRNNKIRVISARDMSKEEREIYAKAEKDTEF